MKALGQTGRTLPKARSDDLSVALELLRTFGSKPAVVKRMEELRDGTTTYETARADAEAAAARAKQREAAAQKAEDKAIRARQTLVDDTKKAHGELVEREKAVAARESLGGVLLGITIF